MFTESLHKLIFLFQSSRIRFPQKDLRGSTGLCFAAMFHMGRADGRSLPHRTITFTRAAVLLRVPTFVNSSLRVGEKQACNEPQMINAHFGLICDGRLGGRLGAGAICL